MTGWKGRGLSVENRDIPVSPNSIFSEIIAKRNYYRGPLLNIPANGPLISLLDGSPQDCLMIPLQIRDRIIGLLYADNDNSSVMDASLPHINTLVTMASYSFEIIILRRKILDL